MGTISRDVVVVRCSTSRRARTGLVRRGYTADEIDAFAAYCRSLDACYLIPLAAVAGSPAVRLRVTPARNNQSRRIRNAIDFDFAARLGGVTKGP
jgi:hypothetical protein